MSKALVVINADSGGYSPKVEARIRQAVQGYELTWAPIDKVREITRSQAVDLLVVAGGDGTLHAVLNCLSAPLPLLYVPCGTLNEKAKSRMRLPEGAAVLGRYGDKVYTYVAAAGSFTPIGYITDVRAKRRLGRLAYLSKVIKEYRVHRIPAALQVDGVAYSGIYTLLMVIKSDRCFGFRFNHLYDSGLSGHILLIKAPESVGIMGKIRIFFPFFRAFFVGFRRNYSGKNMVFLPFAHASVHLSEAVDFDIDGERVPLIGDVSFDFAAYGAPFEVLRRRKNATRLKTEKRE